MSFDYLMCERYCLCATRGQFLLHQRIFPKYFKSDAQANEYAKNEQKIGNYVYGNRLGNGGESTGEGFKFRGRGMLQVTGKVNYQKFGIT